MNKIGLLVVLLLFVISNNNAQTSTSKQDQIENYRIAYFSRVLKLTPTEAKLFWPVYDTYQTNLKALRKKFRMDAQETILEDTELTDAEASRIIAEMIQFRHHEVELIELLVVDLKKILPLPKVAMVFKAELSFRKELLKRLQQEKTNK